MNTITAARPSPPKTSSGATIHQYSSHHIETSSASVATGPIATPCSRQAFSCWAMYTEETNNPATSAISTSSSTAARTKRRLIVKLSSFRLRQRPLPGLVPDLIAGQPPPRGLDGEDAGELRRVPPATVPRRALPPQAQRLPFEQVRAVPQRGDDAGLGGNGRVAGVEPGLQRVDVVARLQAVAQGECRPAPHDLDLEVRVAALVVALNGRDLDAQQAPLSGLGV